ncbi:MAG: polyprenyl synthetase family protein [Bacillota bacterium]|nr:polyprenyl synthetase family protein [Bacillota bacterium]
MSIIEILADKKAVIDRALDYFLPDEKEYPQSVHRAVRYSVFAGGKRIRPILVLLTAELFMADFKKAIPAACALELIHTYSLIHDDLPAMDDDDYRRGQLTSHKVFGEGIAILTGDALLTMAFEILSDSSYWDDVKPEIRLKIISEIAGASGIKGMIGGQVVDLESEGKNVGAETLEYIDTHKTGALFSAAIRLGAILSEAKTEDLDKLTDYSRLLGNAFQIVDDLLDVEGDEKKMGKATGADARKEKANFISYYGIERAKEKRDQLYLQALKELEYFGEKAGVLKDITQYMLYRNH